jgi:hypothetical protein
VVLTRQGVRKDKGFRKRFEASSHFLGARAQGEKVLSGRLEDEYSVDRGKETGAD